jgi:hypothetical protein
MWDVLMTGVVTSNSIVQKHLSISVSMDVMRMTNTQATKATQAATAILAESSVRELRNLRVDRSANDQQLAQEAIRQVAGGMQVVNHVDVTS